MRLTQSISLVASGKNGLSLSNALDCNVYLVDSGSGLILIDAGSGEDTDLILDNIRADGYDPKDIKIIFLTHAHADHGCGVAHLQKISGAAVMADYHEGGIISDGKLLTDTMAEYIRAGFYPEGYKFPPYKPDRLLADGETITIGKLELKAIVAPGHTGGGLCIYGEIDGKNTLFSGDVVFWGGKINLMSIFDADLLRYKQSIFELEKLPVDRLLGGHLQPVMNNGRIHITAAADKFRAYSTPESIC